MKWFLLLCAILVFVTSGFALQCPTCRGSDCNLPSIPPQECSFYSPYPLFKLPLILKMESNFRCLYLEYYPNNTSEELEKMRQCIIQAPERDVCEMIRQKFTVKRCFTRIAATNVGTEQEPLATPATRNVTTTTTTPTTATTQHTGTTPTTATTQHTGTTPNTTTPATTATQNTAGTPTTAATPTTTTTSTITTTTPSPTTTPKGSTTESPPTTVEPPITTPGRAEINQASIIFLFLTAIYVWLL